MTDKLHARRLYLREVLTGVPCRKCGQTDRYPSGSCRPCMKAESLARRLPCRACGATEKVKLSWCAPCLAARQQPRCSIDNCDRPSIARSWCALHWARWRRRGDPIGTRAARFWSKVQQNDGCWLWMGARVHGYGQIDGLIAHRVAWNLARGPIPDGLYVCHHCDNPQCVRPDHLFLGDAKANGQDMARKGRAVYQRNPQKAARGERHHAAKLTAEAVQDIRTRLATGTTTLSELSRELGMSRGTLANVRDGVTWRHV